MRSRRLFATAAFVGLLAGGLAYGLWPSGTRPTLSERVHEIASGVRCPASSCVDLSVAESDDPSSVAIRTFIRSELVAGKSPSEIDAALVARYGPGILLAPQASGFGLLAWLLPSAALVLLAAGAGVGLVRRRVRLAPADDEPSSAPGARGRPALAGPPEVDVQGHAARRPSAAFPGRLRNLPPRLATGVRLGLCAGLLGLSVLGGLALGSAMAKGTPGGSDLQLAHELVEGRALLDRGEDVAAAKVFSQVLSADPRQPEGLAYEGFLLEQAGRSSHDPALFGQALALEREAVAVDPSYPDAHLFLALVLAEDEHDPADAVAQARLFLADHPSAALVQRAAPVLRRVFAEAGVAPPVLPGFAQAIRRPRS